MASHTATDTQTSYVTAAGIRISRVSHEVCAQRERASLARALDSRRGLLLSSNYEYPGRYRRIEYGFVDPLLVIEAKALTRELRVRALAPAGQVLLAPCLAALRQCSALDEVSQRDLELSARVREPDGDFAEEERTRAPCALSGVRALLGVFESPDDPLLGLYGAFGHDLVFQFEALRARLPRAAEQRDLVLYLPDRLLVVDPARGQAQRVQYELSVGPSTTAGMSREPYMAPEVVPGSAEPRVVARDHAPGEFAQLVTRAREAFARGDLFEVTPSQQLQLPCAARPSEIFETLQQANPAPYGFLANLGAGEHLIGASPEMFVRVAGRRVETCPIAGTIARGGDALADAAQILKLLESAKDEAELTMCTDVDRNDKARVCEPGSVRVIGRRQIELYSRLIHTVDHVEGRLRGDFDAIDAFLTHMWAVTVTGAPKQDALQFIEDHERTVRGFYGGAIGALRFDGSLDTGLVLRTIRLRDGVASLRAGATLHFDSDPSAEEQETELKTSALLSVLRQLSPDAAASGSPPSAAAVVAMDGRTSGPLPKGLRVLLIDHRDSFVHTLADYFRQLGCTVTTLRFDRALCQLSRLQPQLVVLSPGPCRPDDFGMRRTLGVLAEARVPVFGVCLGLQGMVEFCGGTLLQLPTPMHGKPSDIDCIDSALFRGLSGRLRVGRYHSLYARASELPGPLQVLARSAQDGACMALAHRSLPWTAVQFHPESILSAESGKGVQLIGNVVALASQRSHQAPGPVG